MSNPTDKDCICYGNWRQIVKEVEPFFEKTFKQNGSERNYILMGVVNGKDDYYYLFFNTESKHYEQWSCVGSLEGYGLVLSDE